MKSAKNTLSLQLTAVLLMVIFIFIQFGPFIAFKAEQWQIRKDIKKQIKNGVSEKELFIFYVDEIKTDNSFSWEKEDKEFHYRNSMYDIVRKETLNGKEIYKCINDKQEHNLFVNLDQLVKDYMSQKSSPTKQLKLISFLYMEEIAAPSLQNFNEEVVVTEFRVPRLLSMSREIPSPPPNTI